MSIGIIVGFLLQAPANAQVNAPLPSDQVAAAVSIEPALDQAAAGTGPLPAAKTAHSNEIDDRGCRTSTSPGSEGEILVCGHKTPRFRIDPDLIAAKRLAKEQRRRPRPSENVKDTSCQVVGPAGCMMAPAIDLLRAASVLADIGEKLAKGESVAKIFATGSEKSEYEIYRELRKKRKAEELPQGAPPKARSEPAEVRDETPATTAAPSEGE